MHNQTLTQNPYQTYITYTQPSPYIRTTYPYYQNPPPSSQPQWPRHIITWSDTSYPNQYTLQPHHTHYQNTNTNQDNHFAQSFIKGIKLEFPKFDGDNPKGWLRQVEKCFTLVETPKHKKVKFSEVFFSGKADHWLRSTSINTNSLSWSEFLALIISRFAAETSLELIDAFQHME
jgi:hypothetical protein